MVGSAAEAVVWFVSLGSGRGAAAWTGVSRRAAAAGDL